MKDMINLGKDLKGETPETMAAALAAEILEITFI